MNKFVTFCEEEYHKEKEKREKIYENACKLSGDLWDFYEKNPSKENYDKFKKAYNEVDPAYLDWTENVIFESKEY